MAAIPAPQTRQGAVPFYRRPYVGYAFRRFIIFLLTIWVAASLNFFLPRLASGRDPVRTRLGMQAATGGQVTGIQDLVDAYSAKFGLEQPLWKQYINYLKDVATFDFGFSIANYPARVSTLIGQALPWTIMLLITATLIGFVLGTLAGALLGWEKRSRSLDYLFMPLLTISAMPYYIMGLILVYFFAFRRPWFPLTGGYDIGKQPEWNLAFVIDAFHHSLLPALSIILAQMGTWAIGMRGMMVMTEGEDYMTYAEARGIGSRTIFMRYAVRNAILPQVTSLALSLGTIVSQAVLVEVVFGYPGIGTLLYRSVIGVDYFLIYGVVMLVVFAIALMTLVLDLILPLLDPRITYQR